MRPISNRSRRSRPTRATASSRPTSATAPRMARRCSRVQARCRHASGGREPCRPLDRGARRPSSRPTSSAPTCCWRPRCAYWRELADGRPRRFRFHHVSTDEVYGSLGRGAVHRGHALRPELALFGQQGRGRPSGRAPGTTPTACRWSLTNCSNNYGPYQFPEKLIPLMIIKALAGKPLPVYGTGEQRPRLAPCRGSRARRCRGR